MNENELLNAFDKSFNDYCDENCFFTALDGEKYCLTEVFTDESTCHYVLTNQGNTSINQEITYAPGVTSYKFTDYRDAAEAIGNILSIADFN